MNQKIPVDVSPEELNQWILDDFSKLILVDVRETDELSMAPFSFQVLHLPLSRFPSWAPTVRENLHVDKEIVVLCHSGVRSWNFGVWLLEQDFQYSVWNLKGGIDAWSQLVDDSVPRY